MTKVKRSLLCLIVAVFVIGVSVCFTGCQKEDDTKYNVTIKVVNNFGEEWVFTPDVSELYYEMDYTGEEMRFWIDSYNLPDHPTKSNEWYPTEGSGPNVFHTSKTYRAPNELNKVHEGPVKERGEYCILSIAESTSVIWNFRAVRLFVTII